MTWQNVKKITFVTEKNTQFYTDDNPITVTKDHDHLVIDTGRFITILPISIGISITLEMYD